MEELVSIVVPIYNTQDYLKQCIDSLIRQTYKNIEIILVDDGSTDNSFLMCQEYGKKDKRVRCIHKENGGVSSARNVGIRNATGKYLCFCDSDDWYAEDAIFSMVKSMEETNSDYVASGRFGGAYENKIFSKMENPFEILNYLTLIGSYNTISKLFKTQLVKDNNLYFDEEFAIAEDTLWLREYFLYCNYYTLVTKTIYYVNERRGSLTRSGYKQYPLYAYYYERKLEALDKLTQQLPITDAEKKNFVTERAIHGIKISLFNYYAMVQNSSKSKDQYVSYINYIFDQLSPWILIDEVKSQELNNWYKKYKKYILSKDAEGIVRHLIIGYKLRITKQTISQMIKWK